MPRAKRSFENKIYPSMKVLAAQEGVPFSHLKAAKALVFPGFLNDNSIDWNILKPEYEKRLSEVEAYLSDSMEDLKRDSLKKDIAIKELKIAEFKKQLIAMDEINLFMVKFATSLNSLLLGSIVTEMPPSLVGRTEEEIRQICKITVNNIIGKLKQDIDEWNPATTAK